VKKLNIFIYIHNPNECDSKFNEKSFKRELGLGVGLVRRYRESKSKRNSRDE